MSSQIQTRDFGAIHYEPTAALRFAAGLPGFESETEFLPLHHPDYGSVVFLQSLQTPALCFLALPAQLVHPDYRLNINSEDLAALGFPAGRQPVIGRDVLCLVLLSLLPGELPTANLLSPLVIRLDTLQAVQAVQFSGDLSHAHPLTLAAHAEPVCS